MTNITSTQQVGYKGYGAPTTLYGGSPTIQKGQTSAQFQGIAQKLDATYPTYSPESRSPGQGEHLYMLV